MEGMAYVNWLGKDDLTLNFSRESIALDHSAHFRVDTSSQAANLAVFKGNVDVEGPAGKLVVEKKKTATFNPADEDKYTVAKNVPTSRWTRGTKKRFPTTINTRGTTRRLTAMAIAT